MTKIVFFDIDGTLVNHRNVIPESTKQAVKQLKANGVIPVIATGRPPILLYDIQKELEIDSYISMNGQLIIHEGEVLYDNPIETETVERLMNLAVERKDGIILCGSKDIYSNALVSLAKRSSVWTVLKALTKVLPGRVQLSLLKRAIKKPPNREEFEDKAIYEIMLETSMEEEKQYRDEFPELHFARSNTLTVDIISSGVSKATGIKRFLERVGGKIENTYAFGDSPNDFEMLDFVQTGVAMGNGWDEVKERADFVTTAVDEDGIQKALKQFDLI